MIKKSLNIILTIFLFCPMLLGGMWGNDRYPLMKQIDDRIYNAKGSAVQLTNQEQKVLFDSFGMELRKFFGAKNLSKETWAYWGRSLGFFNRNEIRMIRFSKDKGSYARVIFNGSGIVLMHDSSATNPNVESEVFQSQAKSSAEQVPLSLKGTYDGMNYVFPSKLATVMISGVAVLKTLTEKSVDGAEQVAFRDGASNSFAVMIKPQSKETPANYIKGIFETRKQKNPSVDLGALVTGEPMFIETKEIVLPGDKKFEGSLESIFIKNGLEYQLSIKTRKADSHTQAGDIIRKGIDGLMSAVGVVKHD